MLSATTFTYDGVFSGQYGMIIAEINAENIQETTPFAPVVRAVKTQRQLKFTFAGIEYADMPRMQFSFICEESLPDLVRRELLTWLVGRNGFRKLQIHQPDYNEYEYNCIFEETRLIYINGKCHGFVLTATFDSHYCYAKPIKKTVKSTGAEYLQVTIINNSDIIDDYVYPLVKFKAARHVANKSISIINLSDLVDPTRAFEFLSSTEFGEINSSEVIEVDNELKIITSSISGDRLSNFNKNWLRLVKGVNRLQILIDGECTIECPEYVKIGF